MNSSNKKMNKSKTKSCSHILLCLPDGKLFGIWIEEGTKKEDIFKQVYLSWFKEEKKRDPKFKEYCDLLIKGCLIQKDNALIDTLSEKNVSVEDINLIYEQYKM